MEYTLYKPNKGETGCAVKFNIHKSGKFAFMKVAKQIAPMGSSQMFAWDDTRVINVKLGDNDLTAMYAVLHGMLPEVSLFHKTDRDNKIIDLKRVPEKKGFSLRVSHKMGNSEAIQMFVGIRYQECAFLIRFVEHAIDSILASNVWSGDSE